MVANDQSEDAHAANGMIMNNNVAYRAKQAGGTVKDVLKLGTDDIIRLSQIRYQIDDANSITNSTEENLMPQIGWVQIEVTGGPANASETVTFPTAFSTIKHLIVNLLGYKATSISSLTDASAVGTGKAKASAHAITATNFLAFIQNGDASAVSNGFYMVSWTAFGT